MNISEAQKALADEELVAVMATSLQYVKEVRDRCLEVDLPVLIGDLPGKG